MKKNTIIIAAAALCFALCSCSETKENKLPEITVISESESTDKLIDMITETSAMQSSEAVTSEEISEEVSEEVTTEVIEEVTETEADTSAASDRDNSEYIAIVSRLAGALDYIDQIGGGNIPKDDSDKIDVNGREFARVYAQFENTDDLREFMEDSLTQRLIDSRYSHILGTDEPYYVDENGGLYGYVTAKGCGYAWILVDDKPVIEILDISEDSFTASIKFDNYGGESDMVMNIVSDSGMWKIDRISYDGLEF